MVKLFARAAVPLAAIALVAACTRPQPQTPRPPNAAEILSAMVSTYRGAASYEDHGAVVENFIGSHSRQADFDTVLVRSSGFRFDVRDEWGGSPGVFWTSDGKLHSHHRGGTITDRKSLGGSRFYSSIPSLLLPAYAPGPTLASLQRLRLAPNATIVDGHACWELAGNLASGADMTLWIDQSSHLLRKTVERTHFEAAVERPAFDVETTTEYRPSLDGPIAVARVKGPDPESLPAARQEPWIGVGFAVGSLRIVRVLGSTPAQRAGLQVGDEVVAIAGTPAVDASAFISRIQREGVGANVAIVVRRNGVAMTVQVTIGDRMEYASLQAALIGKPAPAFTAVSVTEPNPISLSALAGSVVVLDFTPPTFVRCNDCESPEGVFMSKLQDKYRARGVRIVGLSNEDPAALKTMAAELTRWLTTTEHAWPTPTGCRSRQRFS